MAIQPLEHRTARPPRSIDRDRRLVHAAIRLVAGGAASRVTVVGVRHGARLLAEADFLTLAAGLEVRGESGARGHGTIVIEAPSR